MNQSKRTTATTPSTPPTAPLAALAGEEIAELGIRIGDLAVRAGRRWSAIQNQAVTLGLAEWRRRQTAWIDGVERAAGFAEWSSLGAAHAYARGRSNLEICRAWWEVTLRAQDALLEAMRQGFGDELAAERRRRNVVIPFPDRRLAA